MILPDVELYRLAGKVFPVNCKVGPSSVDMTLGNQWSSLAYKELHHVGDPMDYRVVRREQYLLKPQEFVLAHTEEKIQLPLDVSAYVMGRSSLGRIGLQVHNAGFVDAGFQGQITLELVNQSAVPLLLTAGTRICQIVFMKMLGSAERGYSGKYMNQKGATGSRLHMEYENTDPSTEGESNS